MRIGARFGSGWLLSAGLLVPSLAAATGASGRVVDEARNPLQGARACAVVEGVEQLCETTDVDGRYVLPGRAGEVSVGARGFLPRTVEPTEIKEPIVLERAATLRVRVLDDETGAGIPKGRLSLVYTTGRSMGPFPVNAGGLVLWTLPRGEIRATARADGYRETTTATVELEAGKEREVVVRLQRTPKP